MSVIKWFPIETSLMAEYADATVKIPSVSFKHGIKTRPNASLYSNVLRRIWLYSVYCSLRLSLSCLDL